MAEQGQVEVGAKLVLDDHATHALEKMKGGLERVGEKVSEVQHELGGMLKQALATAVGFQFDRGIESLKELAGEAINAAKNAGSEVKELAGILAMNDRMDTSMGELKEQAKGLHEELEMIGIKGGVSTSVVLDAFGEVASRSKKSTDEIKGLVEQMAQAGKAIPGGAETLASAYKDLESGIVRPRNAIVALLKQTGLVGGSTKDIARGMSEMMQHHPEKAFELADKAIAKMADKMKNQPLGVGAIITSLKDLREQIFENLGEPLLKAMGGPLAKLRGYLLENKEKFEQLAHTLGEQVGEWMGEAAAKIQEGFEYLASHSKEIKEAFAEGAEMVKEAIKFVIDHKEELAIAFGAKAVAPIVGGGISAAGQVGGFLSSAGAGGVSALGGAGAAGAAGGLAGAAMFAAAAAAAVAAWAGVVDQVMKLKAETGGFKSEAEMDIESRQDAMRRLIDAAGMGKLTKEQIAEFDKLRAANVATAEAAGMNAAAIGQQADAIWAAHAAQEAQTAAVDAAYEKGDVGPIVAAYEKAQETGDKAMEQYIANLLNNSEDLQLAFVTATDQIKGGFGHLVDLMKDPLEAAHMANLVETMKPKGGEGAKPPAPLNDFRGSTFNIQQDFKDQDPDRIAIVFRSDLVRHSNARIQARTSPALGL